MTDNTHTAQGVHGGDILSMAKRLGCAIDDIIDMSSNLSPFGMAAGLRDVLIEKIDEISYLPESGSETLRGVFAEKHGRSPAEVLVGNGTTEFIYALPASLSCKRAVIVCPTYGDYRLASSWAGLEVADFHLQAGDDFSFDFARLSSELRGGELVFICNPNNPTSRVVESSVLAEFVKSHPASFFLIDESYLPFVREQSLAAMDKLPDNLFVLSSASKIYGIPGLRLGFLVATEKNMARLAERRKPWGVNRMAQVAGEFLLQHGDASVRKVQDFLEAVRPDFCGQLAALPGVHVVPGQANFILCRLESGMTAALLREKMLAAHIMIRDCHNFTGLDEQYFRVSLKVPEQNAGCLKALAKILGGVS